MENKIVSMDKNIVKEDNFILQTDNCNAATKGENDREADKPIDL